MRYIIFAFVQTFPLLAIIMSRLTPYHEVHLKPEERRQLRSILDMLGYPHRDLVVALLLYADGTKKSLDHLDYDLGTISRCSVYIMESVLSLNVDSRRRYRILWQMQHKFRPFVDKMDRSFQLDYEQHLAWSILIGHPMIVAAQCCLRILRHYTGDKIQLIQGYGPNQNVQCINIRKCVDTLHAQVVVEIPTFHGFKFNHKQVYTSLQFNATMCELRNKIRIQDNEFVLLPWE